MNEKLGDLWARIPEMTVGDGIVALLVGAVVLSMVLSIALGSIRWIFRGEEPKPSKGRGVKR